MVNEKTAVQPGDLVMDIVTGFEGIATARTTWLHGCDRITITPNKLGDNGSPMEEQSFDEQRIEIKTKGKVPAIRPTDEELLALPIGAEAKDIITGFKGIIAGLTVTLAGDIHVAIEPEKLDKEGKPVEIGAFNHSRIEVIKPKAVPQTKAKTTKKDGGPPPRGEGARVR